MVEPRHLDQLLHPMFEEPDGAQYKKSLLGKGLPASPGAAMGRIVFTAEDAEKWKNEGEKVSLLFMLLHSARSNTRLHAGSLIAYIKYSKAITSLIPLQSVIAWSHLDRPPSMESLGMSHLIMPYSYR